MKEAQERVTIPVHYGAQPTSAATRVRTARGCNWSGSAACRRCASTRRGGTAVELGVEDMVHVAAAMWRPVPTASTSTPPAPPATPTSWPPCSPWSACARSTRPWASWSMAAEVALGTHGELEFHGTRLAGLKPEGQCRVAPGGPARPSTAPPSTSTPAARWPGTSRGAHLHEAVYGRRADLCTPTSAWVWAACRCTPSAPSMPLSRCSRACVDILKVPRLVGWNRARTFGMPICTPSPLG